MDENKVVDTASAEAGNKKDLKATIISCVAAIVCVALLMVTFTQCLAKVTENNLAVADIKASANSGSASVDTNAPVVDDSTSTDAPVVDDSTADAPVADDSTADAPAADDSTADAPAADAGDASGSKMPATKAEIVDYFNKAVNGVKTGAKTVEQKEVTNYLAGKTTISSGIQGIYKMLGGDDWLDGMLRDNSQGAATYTGADIKAKFPVEGEAYASKLTAADVSNATCTESNGVYTIKITTLGDAKSDSIKHGEGHNPKAFNVILPGVVNDNIPGPAVSLVGKASMAYPASTATITVDVATGHVLTAEYDLKWTINFDKMGIVLPFGSKSVYTIKW